MQRHLQMVKTISYSPSIAHATLSGAMHGIESGRLLSFAPIAAFQVTSPPLFFKKVKTVFGDFFGQFDRPFYYDKTNPGFYIENRKLCSLGFRYKNGVSLHGVSLNVDVDLEFHNRINPCGLQNIVATSLKHEGIDIDCNEVDKWIVGKIEKVFDESL